MRKTAEFVKREQPSIHCHKCRQWIESREQVNLFASVDGAPRRVGVWTCPACRGEAGAVAVVAVGPKTQADVSRDERLGPYRAVERDTVVVNPSGKSARVKLACGHEACVLPDATQARCRRCREVAGK